ncbi:MAG: hypothetical protein KBA81_00315 [Rhabdochlamydiaceae bacterium]|nr:hypothetical protein [Rhabdochlamydiaceae bacterium]
MMTAQRNNLNPPEASRIVLSGITPDSLTPDSLTPDMQSQRGQINILFCIAAASLGTGAALALKGIAPRFTLLGGAAAGTFFAFYARNSQQELNEKKIARTGFINNFSEQTTFLAINTALQQGFITKPEHKQFLKSHISRSTNLEIYDTVLQEEDVREVLKMRWEQLLQAEAGSLYPLLEFGCQKNFITVAECLEFVGQKVTDTADFFSLFSQVAELFARDWNHIRSNPDILNAYKTKLIQCIENGVNNQSVMPRGLSPIQGWLKNLQQCFSGAVYYGPRLIQGLRDNYIHVDDCRAIILKITELDFLSAYGKLYQLFESQQEGYDISRDREVLGALRVKWIEYLESKKVLKSKTSFESLLSYNGSCGFGLDEEQMKEIRLKLASHIFNSWRKKTKPIYDRNLPGREFVSSLLKSIPDDTEIKTYVKKGLLEYFYARIRSQKNSPYAVPDRLEDLRTLDPILDSTNLTTEEKQQIKDEERRKIEDKLLKKLRDYENPTGSFISFAGLKQIFGTTQAILDFYRQSHQDDESKIATFRQRLIEGYIYDVYEFADIKRGPDPFGDEFISEDEYFKKENLQGRLMKSVRPHEPFRPYHYTPGQPLRSYYFLTPEELSREVQAEQYIKNANADEKRQLQDRFQNEREKAIERRPNEADMQALGITREYIEQNNHLRFHFKYRISTVTRLLDDKIRPEFCRTVKRYNWVAEFTEKFLAEIKLEDRETFDVFGYYNKYPELFEAGIFSRETPLTQGITIGQRIDDQFRSLPYETLKSSRVNPFIVTKDTPHVQQIALERRMSTFNILYSATEIDDKFRFNEYPRAIQQRVEVIELFLPDTFKVTLSEAATGLSELMKDVNWFDDETKRETARRIVNSLHEEYQRLLQA